MSWHRKCLVPIYHTDWGTWFEVVENCGRLEPSENKRSESLSINLQLIDPRKLRIVSTRQCIWRDKSTAQKVETHGEWRTAELDILPLTWPKSGVEEGADNYKGMTVIRRTDQLHEYLCLYYSSNNMKFLKKSLWRASKMWSWPLRRLDTLSWNVSLLDILNGFLSIKIFFVSTTHRLNLLLLPCWGRAQELVVPAFAHFPIFPEVAQQ